MIRGFIKKFLSGQAVKQVEEPPLPMEFKNLSSICYNANEYRATLTDVTRRYKILNEVHRIRLDPSGHAPKVYIEPYESCTVSILNPDPRECTMEAVYRKVYAMGDVKELFVTLRCGGGRR